MKEALVALLARTGRDLRPGVAREWLQAAALDSLGRSGSFAWLAFHGGTALRFLYGIARFSGDLDFTHEGPEPVARVIPSLGRLKDDLWREMIPVRVDLAERPRLVEVRLDFLNDALTRSGWNRAALDSSTWLAAVQGRLAVTDWERVRADVAAFLETPEEASLLTENVFQGLLERRRLSGPRR